MSEQPMNKQHIAVDPQATWNRMEEMVRKAATTPRSLVEKSIAQGQASKPKRKRS